MPQQAFTPNWLAVFLAAISTFVLGGLWYAPMIFGSAWSKLNRFTPEEMASRKMGQVFAFSFVLTLISAINLAFFLGSKPSIGFGALAGFLVGVWVAASFGITSLFEKKAMPLFLINAGYHVVSFSLMGIVIAALGN